MRNELERKLILSSILLTFLVSGCCTSPDSILKGKFVLNPTPKFYSTQDYRYCTPKPNNFTIDVVIPQELYNKIEVDKEYIVMIGGCDNKLLKITTDENEAYSWWNYSIFKSCSRECGDFNVSASFNISKLIMTANVNSKKDANFSFSLKTAGPCRSMSSEEVNNLEKNGIRIIAIAGLGACPITCDPNSHNSSINLKAGDSKVFEFVSNCINSGSGTYLIAADFECSYLENNLTHSGYNNFDTVAYKK